MDIVTVIAILLVLGTVVCLLTFVVGVVTWSLPISRKLRTTGGLGFILCLILITAMPCNFSGSRRSRMETEVKASLTTVQFALDRYGLDHEWAYPERIDVLFEENYFLRLPENPFTDESMRAVEFGADGFEGNFTYLPVREGEEVVGYYLIGYGHQETEGMDVDQDGSPDHVLRVLNSTPPDGPTLPPIHVLLR